MQCKPEEGKGCVDYRGSAAGPGVSSVTIVRILNQTEIGAAKHRLLAFSGSVYQRDRSRAHQVQAASIFWLGESRMSWAFLLPFLGLPVRQKQGPPSTGC
eukprot:1159119-Pelagomonas_calceolata.AAC.2